MSAIEETNSAKTSKENPVTESVVRETPSLLTSFLNLLSSVRLGIILLIILAFLAFVGMIIMQQNIQGFDKYYAARTPSEKLVGSALGLFDIYHTWYYNVLLLLLSLNVILASIERAPKSWRIVSNRKLEASRTWLLAQQQHLETKIESNSLKAASERVLNALRSMRLKTTVLEKDGRVHIFAEKGWWNRLGYLAVHVGLLTIFTGGFLTNQFGQEGMVPLEPGQTSSQMFRATISLDKVTQTTAQLPFAITCTDIEQKLIRKDDSIDGGNTIDWLTRIKIKDEYGEREALVNLNRPYDYRGYRFFQASFAREAPRARNITLLATPENGAPVEVKIPRGGSTNLPDGTRIDFKEFYADFTIRQNGLEEIESSEYVKPVAVLQVTKPNGEPQKAFAFNMELPSGAPVGAPVAGYKFRLADFEKVSLFHTLSLNKDPGRIPFYAGGTFLIATLIAVFFFSHQRVWALVEEDESEKFNIVLGGNTNRNQLGFEDKFKGLVEQIGEKANDQEKTQEAKA
jgi:cytochrome c biogenesis protein